jgi:hypothetical protein
MSASTKTNKLVSVGLYLDAEELQALKEAAKNEGRSLSSYVRRLFFGDGCITTRKPATKKPSK